MNITVINGVKSGDETNSAVTNAFSSVGKNHNVSLYTIAEMDISYCCGCFSCWVKNPGVCIYKDDMPDVLESIVKSDLLLVVSPIDAGFITSEAKKTLDRILPLVLPFIKEYGGESHHIPRYDNQADLGILLLDEGEGIDEEAADIVYESFDRMAKNFHAKRVIKAAAKAQNLLEVIENEISSY